MSNIEVGEYVRTNRGIITKVIDFRKETRFTTNRGTISHSPARYYFKSEKVYSLTEPHIKAHSFNIIDLIEVGDYVNGEKVREITKNYISVGSLTIGIKDLKGIKSIVTKEQFKEMEYRIDE